MQNLASLATETASNPQSGVIGAIRQASAKSGVDFSYLLQKASIESSLNPNAKALTSSASGLYQFIDQTWMTELSQHGAEYGLSKEASAISVDSNGHASIADPAMRKEIMGLKNDPTVAAEMAAAFTKDNQQALQANVGGKIGSTELYLAHFLGAGGATKFLNAMHQNPEQSGADIMPAAADANEPVFYHANGSPRSLAEIYNRFAAKFDGTTTNVAAASSAPATANTTPASVTLLPNSFSAPSSISQDSNETTLGVQGRASLYESMILSQLSAMQSSMSKKLEGQETKTSTDLSI